jgi:hypothetical protein
VRRVGVMGLKMGFVKVVCLVALKDQYLVEM